MLTNCPEVLLSTAAALIYERIHEQCKVTIRRIAGARVIIKGHSTTTKVLRSGWPDDKDHINSLSFKATTRCFQSFEIRKADNAFGSLHGHLSHLTGWCSHWLVLSLLHWLASHPFLESVPLYSGYTTLAAFESLLESVIFSTECWPFHCTWYIYTSNWNNQIWYWSLRAMWEWMQWEQ